MKKVLLMLLIVSTMAFSQDLAFKKGTNTLNAGFLLTWGNGLGATVAWDHGSFNDMFSLGADVEMYFDGEEGSYLGYTYDINYMWINPNFRFGFHPFGIPSLEAKNNTIFKKIDPYAVFKLGLAIERLSTKYDKDLDLKDESDVELHFGWDIAAGIRWFATEKFNLWTEAGYGSWAVGVGFAF